MVYRRLVGVISGALIIGVVPAVGSAQPAAPDDPTTVRVAPSGSDRGAWRVRSTDAATAVEWRSPARLPITDARPEFRLGDRLLGYPEVGADGRTLTLSGVELTDRQRGRLEVWLGTDRLDTAGRRDLPRVDGSVEPPVGPTTTPAADPGEPGEHPITRFDYRSAPRPWLAYPSPLEVVGHAVLPSDVDSAPLVMFLHGRHQACYGRGDNGDWPCAGQSKPVPSQLGYDYAQRVLASQGYATVSIAANAINQQDWKSPDGGASARSALVRHHLKLLARWTADPQRPRWYGKLDLDRVVLVGHSRGGEGVDQAVIDTRAEAPYTVAGQVLIGPVDFAHQTAGYMPTAVLLPYCDGDVYDLQGQRYVDAAGTVTADDPTLRSSILLRGANHNFFNTEWTPGLSEAPSNDDWYGQNHPLCGRKASPTRLTAAEQRRSARTFIGAAVHGFLDSDPAALDVLDSDRPVELPAAGGAIAWTHALGGDRDTVRPGAGATVTGAADVCRSGAKLPSSARALPLCGSGGYERELHWTRMSPWWLSPATPYFKRGLTRQLRLAWDRPGTVGGLRLAEPLDLSGPDAALDLRVVSDPARHPTRLAVRLTDGDGTTWTAPDAVLRRLPGSKSLVAVWSRPLRVGLSDAPADLDRADIRAVDLVTRSDSGRVWVLDASARRPVIAPAPDARLPSIRVGKVKVTEGNAGGARIAKLPYTVVGEVTSPARFAVAMDQRSFGHRASNKFAVVTVSPGDTSGVIEVPFQSDRRDDRRIVQPVVAVPLRGLAMGDYYGRVIVIDDDPTPTLRLNVRRQRVEYGQRMVFVARLSAPADYAVMAELHGIVLDRYRPLRVGDVRDGWIRRRLATVPPDRAALARWIRGDDVKIAAGSVRSVFRVPTKAHPFTSRPKALTLRLTSDMLRQRDRATVRVR